MTVLVIADHNNHELHRATLSSIAAAHAINSSVHVIVVGFECTQVVNEVAKIAKVEKVLQLDHVCYEHQLAENVSSAVYGVVQSNSYSHVLTASTTTGKNMMPRVAAMLDTEQLSDIIRVENENVFDRPIYAGNAITTIESNATIKVLTVRVTSFDPVDAQGGNADIELIDLVHEQQGCSFVSESVAKTDRPDLASSDIVISGGRGLGSKENFEQLFHLADKLGAAVGASRAAVDAGFVSNDLQVGQTGKVVAPNLYIAFGISGAIQHLAGMKESKIVVAVNKDEDAPIFQIADYGLVADLFLVLPELTQKLD